jgi:DNA-binding response OmpR family regulator
VLLDVRLQTKGGVELLGELRRQYRGRQLPVAVLSNWDHDDPALAGVLELGVLACLVTSQTVPSTLVDRIHDWFRPGGRATDLVVREG